MAAVQSVPFFTTKALTNFLSKSNDDYERLPLLAVGCFCLLASRFQNWCGYDWGHIVDLGMLGETMSDLTSYWELVDFASSAKEAMAGVYQIYPKDDTADLQIKKVAKQVFLFSCKAISNAANLVGMLQQTGALKCFCIHQIKLVGAALGSLYFINSLYDTIREEVAPEGIETLKEEAKEAYRTQHARRTLCGRAIKISILSMKVIGFFSAFYALYGGVGFIKSVVDRKGDLLLTSFSTFMASVLGAYFLNEQMAEFRKLNQRT